MTLADEKLVQDMTDIYLKLFEEYLVEYAKDRMIMPEEVTAHELLSYAKGRTLAIAHPDK